MSLLCVTGESAAGGGFCVVGTPPLEPWSTGQMSRDSDDILMNAMVAVDVVTPRLSPVDSPVDQPDTEVLTSTGVLVDCCPFVCRCVISQ